MRTDDDKHKREGGFRSVGRSTLGRVAGFNRGRVKVRVAGERIEFADGVKASGKGSGME